MTAWIGFLALTGCSALVGAAALAAQAPPQPPVDGAAIYAQNCAACHQPDGKGIPGAFPALEGDVFVQGAPALVAKTVLEGRGGMPSFADDLSDQQIAAVLTRVRSSWGNHAPAIPVETVAGARHGAVAAQPSVLPGH